MLAPAQTALLRQAIAELRPRFRDAGLYFYQRLFALDPELREVCPSGASEEEAVRLMETINSSVMDLDDWPVLLARLDQMGREQVRLGVRPEHYESVGSCLMATLNRFLRDSWSLEMEDAWLDFYAEISSRLETAGQQSAG